MSGGTATTNAALISGLKVADTAAMVRVELAFDHMTT
jgi:hypothetical protein